MSKTLNRFTCGQYVLNILIAIDQFGKTITPRFRPLSKVIAWGQSKIKEENQRLFMKAFSDELLTAFGRHLM